MLTPTKAFPITRRSMSIWARWRAGSDSTRRHEEQGLHPDEAAGLRQLAGNLLDAGEPLGKPGWFHLTGNSISLSERAARLLFRGLQIDARAVGGVSAAPWKRAGRCRLRGPKPSREQCGSWRAWSLERASI